MQQRMQSHGYRQAYPHAAYLVLQRGDTPIGRLILDRQDKVLHLVDIAILPAAHGQGAGSAVRALYQRLGFRLRGENRCRNNWNGARHSAGTDAVQHLAAAAAAL